MLALTCWGEARSQSIRGVIAVANVVQNRVSRQHRPWGLTAREVCLAPWQFSCWGRAGGHENYAALCAAAQALRDGVRCPELEVLRDLATRALADTLGPDLTNGATHYCTRTLYASAPPLWSRGQKPAAWIDGHVFFRLEA